MSKKVIDRNAEIEQWLSDKGITHDEDRVSRTSAKAFRKAIKKGQKSNAKGWQVYVHPKFSTDDDTGYKDMKCFLNRDHTAGFAIETKTGNVVSLFARGGAKSGQAAKMLPFAVEHGGKKLDCYSTFLPKLYSKFGAQVVSRTKWDDAFAPDGWSAEEDGRPDLVAMVLPKSFEEMKRLYQSSPDPQRYLGGHESKDYNAMLKYRDDRVESVQRKLSSKAGISALGLSVG